VQPAPQISNEKLLEEPRQLGTGSGSRFQKTVDTRGHYLFLGAREPIALESGKVFLIGRDPRASLVVHALEVSRQHCEVDWKGDPPRPILVEVRAKNGTFVNDKPLHRNDPEPLRDRDVIRLGKNFELVYRQLDERELREMMADVGRSETRAIRLPASAPPAHTTPPVPMPVPIPASYPAPAVAPAAHLLPDTGDLSKVPGALLLDLLHRERRSGKLTVFDGQTVGEVQVADGRARGAIFGTLQAREALEAIAQTVRGAYRFVPDAVAQVPTAPPAMLVAQPAIPPELLAAYQALGAQAPAAPMPDALAPRTLPPELAAMFAGLSGPPPTPLSQPLPPPRQVAPPSAPPPVMPLKGASEPSPAQIAAALGNETQGRGSSAASRPPSGAWPVQPPPMGGSTATSRPPSGTWTVQPPPMGGPTTASRSPSGTWPVQPPPPARPQDFKPPTQQMPLKPPTQQVPLKPPTQQMRVAPSTEPGSSTSSRQRAQAAEPLKAPADPYARSVKAPSERLPAAAAPYAPSAPPAAANGDSPEGREANVLLATVRAVGLTGDALGSFVGDTVGKLLGEGKIGVALELGERGLDIADRGNFEQAIATRVAFKARVRAPACVARALELVEKGAPRDGPAWAARTAQRVLSLLDPETPPDPTDNTVLGRLAALARR
jgi:hypothetical protein